MDAVFRPLQETRAPGGAVRVVRRTVAARPCGGHVPGIEQPEGLDDGPGRAGRHGRGAGSEGPWVTVRRRIVPVAGCTAGKLPGVVKLSRSGRWAAAAVRHWATLPCRSRMGFRPLGSDPSVWVKLNGVNMPLDPTLRHAASEAERSIEGTRRNSAAGVHGLKPVLAGCLPFPDQYSLRSGRIAQVEVCGRCSNNEYPTCEKEYQ